MKLKYVFRVCLTIVMMLIILSDCEKNQPYETPKFKSSHEKQIAGNLERPSGLASNSYSLLASDYSKNLEYEKGSEDEYLTLFAQSPLYFLENSFTILEKSTNPKISQVVGQLENLSLNPLSYVEFDLVQYFLDFNAPVLSRINDSLFRTLYLTLDNLILNDGSILFSSSSSGKIFHLTTTGTIDVFVEDNSEWYHPQLERITDIIQGTNDKIYAVQAPFIDFYDSTLILAPKKVISLDGTKAINVEFELPSDIFDHPYWTGYEYNEIGYGWWGSARYREQLKIIENSEKGKRLFGNIFYISDMLEDVIYSVDENKNVNVLAFGLRYPTSLAIDREGNIYYTNSPLVGQRSNGEWDVMAYPFELCVLNPETGESKTIHTFTDSYGSRDGTYVKFNSNLYILPQGFNITCTLNETDSNLYFLFTNTFLGTLTQVVINK